MKLSQKLSGKCQERLDVEMACWMGLSDLLEACAKAIRRAGFCVSQPRPHSVIRNINMSVHVSHDPATLKSSALESQQSSALFMLNVEMKDDRRSSPPIPSIPATAHFTLTSKAVPESIMEMIEGIKPDELVTRFLPILSQAMMPAGPKDWMPSRAGSGDQRI
jgi:hypothetical protein